MLLVANLHAQRVHRGAAPALVDAGAVSLAAVRTPLAAPPVTEAAAFVESVNGGNQTVPTLLFPDGSAATNPSIKEVQARLAS